MDQTVEQTPGFLEGAEVARSRSLSQPGFEEQTPLLERDMELKKKLTVALIVVCSVFLGGMAAGAVLGIFV